jgi:pyruvate kinase
MGLVREPREIDFIIQSEPWSEKDLADFRKLMAEQKVKRSKLASKKEKKRYA